MLFFSTPDNGRAERDARRRSRHRANKRRRALIRSVLSAFSILVLGVSLWMIRKMITAKYINTRVSLTHNLDSSQAQALQLHRVAIDASQVSDDVAQVHSPSQNSPADKSISRQLPARTQDDGKTTFGSNSVASAETLNTSGRGADSVRSSSQEAHTTSSSSSKEDKTKQPEAPGLLPPAVDPSVSTRVETKERRSENNGGNGDATTDEDSTPNNIEKKRSGNIENEAKEKETGRSSKEGEGEEVEDEAPEDDTEADGDAVADSIEEEEGGKAPVITLSRKGRGNSNDEENDTTEDHEGEKEGVEDDAD